MSGLEVLFALLCLRLRLPQIREAKDEREADSIERLVNGSCESMSRADCIMCIDVAAAISSMMELLKISKFGIFLKSSSSSFQNVDKTWTHEQTSLNACTSYLDTKTS